MTEEETLLNNLTETSIAINNFQQLISGLTEKIKHCDEIYEKIITVKNDILKKQIDFNKNFDEKKQYLDLLEKNITKHNSNNDIPLVINDTTKIAKEINKLKKEMKTINTEISNQITDLYNDISILDERTDHISQENNKQENFINTIKSIVNKSQNQKIFGNSKKTNSDINWPNDAKSFNLLNIKDVAYTKPYGIEFNDYYIETSTWKDLLSKTFIFLHETYEPAYEVKDISEMNYQDGWEHYYFLSGEQENPDAYIYFDKYNISVRNNGSKLAVKEISCLCEYFAISKESVQIIYH